MNMSSAKYVMGNSKLLFGSVRVNCLSLVQLQRRSASSTQPELSALLKKTPLYDLHEQYKGKLVDFAGFLLPVQYGNFSITASHLHTRQHASIFDVSHMLQTYVRGKDSVECFESICTADIKGLEPNSGTLTIFTNANGGILDDLIVTKVSNDLLYVVSNAACRKQDMTIMQESVERFTKLGKDVSIEFLDSDVRALIALQGPHAVAALEDISSLSLRDLYFMQTRVANVAGVDGCRVTRCGYTGEDGVEISIPGEKATLVVEALLNSTHAKVQLAGLGARDSLRLEAGLCLYGNDIDQQTTPIEAGLAWLVAKRRRSEANFPGADIILSHLKNGCERRRVGIRLERGPAARHGVQILDNGKQIGVVTSGCPSPSLGLNVAMGYVANDYKAVGTQVHLKIRDKIFKATVTKMPFTPAHYYNKPK
ncbi:aminomethyltransferase, mitochondrial [Contarinia nasturtii]|uniref:aminomethyltransferase, mitochondrial n=1 Tax=Contarinia nasturtii TaxID=265458 RepID=UPI0012D48990|nr:aminomethyltransferase, mitochondrial [Contarinia nasturtii]